jgi:flagellar hook-associated protein 2
MSGPISFGGLASGLDTGAIIQALVQAESFPIGLLQTQRNGEQAKLGALNQFEGLVKALQKRAEELSSASGFLANTVTPSQEGIASFTTSGGALAGSYTLEVEQLASASRYAFEAVTDKSADLGGGSVSFDLGGTSYEVEVFAGDDLDDLAAAINEQAGSAVRASVINTSASSTPSYTLVLESRETGLEQSIQNLSVDFGGTIDVDQQLSPGQDARIVLNGLTIERSSNEFGDVIEGLSLTAESLTEADQPITFSVGIDDEKILETLQGFATAYNAVHSFINGQSTYSEEDGAGGVLFGDSALRTVRSALSSTLFDPSLIDATSSFGSLGLVGIKVGVDGTMTVDEAKVKEKLGEDPEAFADFFVDLDGFDNGGAVNGTAAQYQDTTTDTGLFTKLAKELARLLDDQTTASGTKLSGLLNARKEGINKTISSIDQRIEGLEFRLEGFEAQLVSQFAALEESLAGLQSQQAFLGSLSNFSTQG